MLKLCIYTIIHLSLFILFINLYYEYIISYLLIPLSQQNKYIYLDKELYNITNNILFYDNNYINYYPIFEINFNMTNITYILYYLIIIYIILYIVPILILQLHIFVQSSLFIHEKKKINKIIAFYVFSLILIFYINNNINILLLINIFFNTYQQIDTYLFDLNFNLYEYFSIYLTILTINYIWIIFVITYLLKELTNKKIIFFFILIFLSISSFNIYIYIIEIFFFVFSYLIIKYFILIFYYTKRVPLENK